MIGHILNLMKYTGSIADNKQWEKWDMYKTTRWKPEM